MPVTTDGACAWSVKIVPLLFKRISLRWVHAYVPTIGVFLDQVQNYV
ncbi:hypothetical protein J21TS3_52640 [Paenibacillus cookii]|uniref:Uncharacterized protein n=1 Tax=Paenibacillus cookii TaxID=157839 RepID=A0ABQ4M5K6_9BACL|nr:hypothetical protein J21TS3_52640 [Paenibacillus cookii]